MQSMDSYNFIGQSFSLISQFEPSVVASLPFRAKSDAAVVLAKPTVGFSVVVEQ